MPLEPEQVRKLWIALGVSVAFHLSVAVFAEITSNGSSAPKPASPVVEISRVEADGTTRPRGSGDASFNSTPSQALPGFDSSRMKNYNAIEAGVPVHIDVPKSVPPVQSQPQFQPQTSQAPANTTPYPQGNVPVYQGAGAQSNQNPSLQPRQDPPPAQNPAGASTPSVGATAGNQGKTRSRGPNRAAFPVETVEPNVDQSMMANGITNSVEVTVDIAADGSHVERIVRSSGSADVDARVLEAMKQWKWDPAAREGTAIDSNQAFKYTFKPH